MGNELEAYERAGLQKLIQWVKKWVKTREWTNYAMKQMKWSIMELKQQLKHLEFK